MTTQQNVEFENDRIRVTRVKASGPGPGSDPSVSRLDRLIVYLRDGHVKRKEDSRDETLRRYAGDIVWRPRSHHEVTVAHSGEHEVIVIELKT